MKYLIWLLLSFFQAKFCFAMQLDSIYFVGQLGDVVVLINQKTGTKYFISLQSTDGVYCIKSVNSLSSEFREIVFCNKSKAVIRIFGSSTDPAGEFLSKPNDLSFSKIQKEESLLTSESQEFYLDEASTNQAFRDAASWLQNKVNIEPAELWELLRKLDFNKVDVESFSSSQIIKIVNKCVVLNYSISDFSCLQTTLLYLKNIGQ